MSIKTERVRKTKHDLSGWATGVGVALERISEYVKNPSPENITLLEGSIKTLEDIHSKMKKERLELIRLIAMDEKK